MAAICIYHKETSLSFAPYSVQEQDDWSLLEKTSTFGLGYFGDSSQAMLAEESFENLVQRALKKLDGTESRKICLRYIFCLSPEDQVKCDGQDVCDYDCLCSKDVVSFYAANLHVNPFFKTMIHKRLEQERDCSHFPNCNYAHDGEIVQVLDESYYRKGWQIYQTEASGGH